MRVDATPVSPLSTSLNKNILGKKKEKLGKLFVDLFDDDPDEFLEDADGRIPATTVKKVRKRRAEPAAPTKPTVPIRLERFVNLKRPT